MTKEKITLGAVQETLLIPLYARSTEAKNTKPRIDPSYDVEIVNKIDYDFSKFGWDMSLEGCIVRSIILDREAQKYIDEHPNCVVLNFGCGLCTRTSRLDIKNSTWYNIDLPDTIELRNNLIKEKPKCYNIAKSMLDETWPQDLNISTDQDILVIIEGVFMYFTEDEIKKFISIVQSNYKKVFALIEINHPILINNSKRHKDVKNTNATFKWGIKYCKDFEKLGPGIKYNEEWNFFDLYEIKNKLFNIANKTGLIKNYSNKIASFDITSNL